MNPLAIDLYCGLGGWAEGFLSEGWDIIGFDIERHDYGTGGYPGQLVLQDVLTLHGSQFRNAAVIVASPPCQSYSYRAMPWKRAKALPPPDNTLFDACFRIQREASEAAGHHVALIIENVKGAQKWVGPARWHCGSYYLWGDVPALMPMTRMLKNTGGSWFGERDGKPVERHDPRDMRKVLDGSKNEGGSWFAVANNTVSGHSRNPVSGEDGLKRPGRRISAGFNNWPKDENGAYILPDGSRVSSEGIKQGGEWWHDPASMTVQFSSRSHARKAASAQIAKIPFGLSNWIAQCFRP